MKWELLGRHYRCAIAATAIALGMNATAESAFAQTSTPYQEYQYTQNCVPCFVNFAKVPANKRLDISNVSCFVKWDATASPLFVDNIQLVVLNNAAGFVSASTLAPIPTHTMDPNVPHSRLTFSANHTVSVFAKAGQHFRAASDTTGGAAVSIFACHISGQMVTLS